MAFLEISLKLWKNSSYYPIETIRIATYYLFTYWK